MSGCIETINTQMFDIIVSGKISVIDEKIVKRCKKQESWIGQKATSIKSFRNK